MSDAKVVGRFHCERMVNGLPIALSEWRVTTQERFVAVEAARLLAGEVVGCGSAEGGWEVLSEAKNIRIVVGAVEEMALLFRLVGAPGLGVFEFRSEAWTLAEWLGEGAVRSAASDGCVLGELAIRPVVLTTLNGMSVRYLLPFLRVLGHGEKAA